jgi:hypothetical protein
VIFPEVSCAARAVATASLPATLAERLLLALGIAASCYALARFAIKGFAPDGQLPALPALAFLVGLLATGGRRWLPVAGWRPRPSRR